MTTFGRIVGSPAPDYYGGTLTADVALGDTVIHLDDVSDFDEDAARHDGALIVGLEIDGDGLLDASSATNLPYLTFDDDALTVTLAAPSTVAMTAGDRVYVLDPVSGDPVLDMLAYVEIEGSDHAGDTLPAIVTYGLIDRVADAGDADGQAVTLEEDEDGQLVVVDIHGSKTKTGQVRFYQDQTTATGPGEATLRLTYRPVRNSEHIYWNGVYQPAAEWSRDGWTVTLPDEDGVIAAGDIIACEYAYLDDTVRPTVPASAFYIGTTNVAGGGEQTRITFPDGSLPGDVWVLTMYAGNGFGESDARVDEAEGRLVEQSLYDFDFGSAWPDHHCAAWGHVSGWDPDDGSTWLKIVLHSVDHNLQAYLSVYRITGDLSVTFPSGANSHSDPPEYLDNTVDVPGLFVIAVATGADSQQHMESTGWVADYSPGVSGHGRWHADNPTELHIDNASNIPHEEFTSWLAAMLRITEGD